MSELDIDQYIADIRARRAAERGPGRPWQPGQSGNPAGGPPGSPHVLAEYIKKDVLDAWNEVLPDGQRCGPAALRELSPKEFIEAASRICPKELFMAVQ